MNLGEMVLLRVIFEINEIKLVVSSSKSSKV